MLVDIYYKLTIISLWIKRPIRNIGHMSDRVDSLDKYQIFGILWIRREHG